VLWEVKVRVPVWLIATWYFSRLMTDSYIYSQSEGVLDNRLKRDVRHWNSGKLGLWLSLVETLWHMQSHVSRIKANIYLTVPNLKCYTDICNCKEKIITSLFTHVLRKMTKGCPPKTSIMLLAYDDVIMFCSGYSTHNVPECVSLTCRNM